MPGSQLLGTGPGTEDAFGDCGVSSGGSLSGISRTSVPQYLGGGAAESSPAVLGCNARAGQQGSESAPASVPQSTPLRAASIR